MATSTNSLIRVTDVCKEYNGGSVHALSHCNLSVKKGEVVAIIGPSGSGKSTLLRCLNLLEQPTSGTIYFKDVALNGKKVNLDLHRREMGMVFQHFNLFPHLTVKKNLELAPSLLKLKDKEAISKRADELLARVGLADKAGQDYLTLSGGEKQLCILARTIAEDAPLLLLDEPDSALDLANRSRMTALLAQLVHTGGKTALVCLHDPALALDSCDILVVLQGGGVAAVLHPRTDPPAVLQAALAAVYGPLELLPVTDCRGQRRLALLPL